LSNDNAALSRSIIGNLAELREGEVALPRFLFKHADGLYVDPAKLDDLEALQAAVDRIFSAGACFQGLDYAAFTHLLYDLDLLKTHSQGGETTKPRRLARDIVAFRASRRTLYKAVKMGDGKVEYYFEPVFEEDDGGNTDPDGKPALTRATLDFDEFVADMWLKGIRFGINEPTVREFIATGTTGRFVIARRRDAILGKAADIQELAEEIHRDDAPKELPNGRLDLRQFKNRFPQINKGVHLLKKIPLVLGTPGREISGHLIEPPIPKDFDLGTLAGPGTTVVRDANGEFIVSQNDGFLNLDTQTNQISITEKIVNRDGVSVRTTGDLLLTGDEYEEYGEVQEKRTIEGNSIMIHADVFGIVSSRGGTIDLKRNLVGGMALNQKGDIVIEGVASGATLHTRSGVIRVKRAESCVIIGTKVVIENASNCDILAEEVEIGLAEGCALAAKVIRIERAVPRKQSEMLGFVMIPDQGEFKRKINALSDKLEDLKAVLGKMIAESEKLKANPDFRKYVTIAGKVRKGEITLTPEQQTNLQKMAAALSPHLKLLAKLGENTKAKMAEQSALENQLAELKEIKRVAEAGISCNVAAVGDEIHIRTLPLKPDTPSLFDTPPKELKVKLRGTNSVGEMLFAGSSGTFQWQYSSPQDANA